MNTIELLTSVWRNSPDFLTPRSDSDMGFSTPEPLSSQLSELTIDEGFEWSTPEPSDEYSLSHSPASDPGWATETWPGLGFETQPLRWVSTTPSHDMGTILDCPALYRPPPPRYRRKSLPPPYDLHRSRAHRRRYRSQQQQHSSGGRRTPPPSYDEAVFGHLLRDTRDLFSSPTECWGDGNNNPRFSPTDFDVSGQFRDPSTSRGSTPGLFFSTPDPTAAALPLSSSQEELLSSLLTARASPVDARYDDGMERQLPGGLPAVNSGEAINAPTASSPYMEWHSSNSMSSPQGEHSSLQEPKAEPRKGTVKENIYHYFGGNRENTETGGGHYHLWQYLLDVLIFGDASLIQWVGDDGEFLFVDPEGAAKGWFRRKNPVRDDPREEEKRRKRESRVSYNTISRSIRYYYDKGLVAKINGHKHAYKFLLPGLLRCLHNGSGGMSDPEFLHSSLDAGEYCRVRNFSLTPSPNTSDCSIASQG